MDRRLKCVVLKVYIHFQKQPNCGDFPDSTLRKAVESGKLINNEDCKKFGRDWVVKGTAMIREYGKRTE
ncbi:hypothetical protein [Paeniclostridium hominis]|uniref:hypothetical protein n=1 Tax=Paeniclostridium hominis TaxID=2764329 RepID=UPI0022E0DDCC|nr:hypothetical protein [Paeniclostridium hominis]